MSISRIASACLLGCLFVAMPAVAATVTLTVDDVKTARGQILASLCDDPSVPFPGACHGYYAKAPAQAGSTTLTFTEVKSGNYALQVTHDENGNGRPDFPQEGFAFGNDVQYPPVFSKASYIVSGDVSIRVHLVHMLANGSDGVGTSGVAAPPSVTKIDLREKGLYGELYVPSHTRQLPLVIAIGGSEGGLDIMSSYAVSFAQRGYAVLSLAWWKEPGLPQTIEGVPLEYFDRAIAWAKARPEIASDRIGLLGWSRGAEAALLVASRNPDIRAVVGVSPSSFVWSGLNFANPGASNPAWTVAGVPLPWVAPVNAPAGEPFSKMFSGALAVADSRPEVAIPVENIKGPILLLSGSEDRLWPSDAMAERLMERLRLHHFAFSYEHKNYDGAGHGIFVGDPESPLRRADTTAMDDFMGGNAQSNTPARADSWTRSVAFLDKALKK